MERYPKELILKDGTEAVLRPLEASHGEILRRFYEDMPLSDRWYMKDDATDPAIIRQWLDAVAADRAFSILAFVENRVVAHASLLRGFFGATKHVARLRILVAPDFRHKRLGTWMLLDLIRRAMDMGLAKIRSDFVVGIEDLAIDSAYKLDFVKESVLKDYVQDPDGKSYDYQIMIKHLHRDWSDF